MRKYTFIAFALACLPFFSVAQTALTLSITGYDARCNGSVNGGAKATASGGTAPYSYVWAPVADVSDSISGLAAGVYSVTVVDSVGDSVSGSITIHQPAPLTVSIDSIIVPPCSRTTTGVCGCGNTLWAVVSGGAPPYSYLWSPGSSEPGSGNTGDTLMYACYVEFTVSVTDSNNCITTDSLNVPYPASPSSSSEGVGQVTKAGGISTYPNPANNRLNITGQAVTGMSSLAVYDMMGQKLYEQKLNGNASVITIDISKFANGDYLLKTISEGSQTSTHFSVLR